MGGEYLILELKVKCGIRSKCKCGKAPRGIIAARATSRLTTWYTKCIHKFPRGSRPFILRSVKYNYSIYNGPHNINATEVAVYYYEEVPFIIKIKKQTGGTDYYINIKPSNTGEDTANDSWSQDFGITTPQKLKEKLEELSCKFVNTVALDIYKGRLSSSYCVTNKVKIQGDLWNSNKDFYEFKQFANGKPFRVPYISYNGTKLKIPVDGQEVQEVSAVFWRHHFGRPLVVKIVDKDGKTQYYFSKGGNTWSEESNKDVDQLERVVLEQNCLRNRATTIDLSKKNETYCCTHTCKYKRIQVTEQRSTLTSGFISYEHKAVNDDPFTIGNIINSRLERQKGIKYPIEDVYDVTVYYQDKCKNEPLFIYMRYKVDEDYSEDVWYGRITKNGWSPLVSILDTDDQINRALRDNFKTVSRVLTTSCRIEYLPEDTTVSFPKDTGDKPLDSPENTLNKLVNESNEKDIGFFKPKGPSDEIAERNESKALKGKGLSPPKKFQDLQPKTSLTPFDTIAKAIELDLQITLKQPQLDKTLWEQHRTQGPSFINHLPLIVAAITTSPGVIIDIKKDTNGQVPYTYGGSGQDISLTKEENTPDGFVKFTHTKNGGGKFNVTKVEYGKGNEIGDLKQSEIIKEFAVWYWKETAGNMTNPLFIEVVDKDGNYRYHANKGGWNQWSEYTRDNSEDKNPLTGEPLEQALDELNCQLNRAITMDLSESRKDGQSYCCNKHRNSYNVKVYSGMTTSTLGSTLGVQSSRLEYHKHAIEDRNFKLAGIKYYLHEDANEPNKVRKRVKVDTGLAFPIQGPVYVYVFYCNNNPVLIYIKKDGRNGTDKWYKRKDKNDHISKWEEVSGQLNDVASTNLEKIKCDKHRDIVNMLKTMECHSLQECSGAPSVSTPASSSIGISFSDPAKNQSLGVPPIKDQNINALDLGKFMGGFMKIIDDSIKSGLEISKKSEQLTKELFPPAVTGFVNLSKEFIDVVLPPVITIDVWNRTCYPENSNGYKPVVNVTKNVTDPPKGFTEYVHEVKGYKHFTVNGFIHNRDITNIYNGKTIYEVTQASVYYWSSLEDPTRKDNSRPLLIKILKQAGEPLYYENTGSTNNLSWKHTVISSENIQKRLNLLNCKLNSAVVIDINQKPDRETPAHYDACDPSHTNNKMHVSKDATPGSKVLSYYDSYTHTLNNESGQGFHVVGFKNKSHDISIGSASHTTPIFDVKEVKVYMCVDRPIVIYLDTNSRSYFRKWYKHNGSDGWTVVSITDTSSLTIHNYDSILKVLDKLKSNCAPPSVIIDIAQKHADNGYASPNSKGYIFVNKSHGTSESDPPANYDKYTHTVASRPRSYFTLDGLVYSGLHNITIPNVPMQNVTSVSVYYWQHLTNGRPLLMKITTTTSKSKPTDSSSKVITWYENKGLDGDLNWKDTNISGNLEKKLKLLNCQLNSVVTIDLSYTASYKGNWYCCTDHNGSSTKKIYAREVHISCQTHQNQSSIKAYRHFTGVGTTLYGIKYNGGDKVKSITLSGQRFPMDGVESISVFYCKDGIPKLIYIEGGDSQVKGWYQKGDSSAGDNENWTKVELSITPKDLTSTTDHGKYNALVKVLKQFPGCQDYQPCTEPDQEQKDVLNSSPTPPVQSVLPASQAAEAGTALPHGQGNSPGQNPSFWESYEKSIPTVLTGTGVVSGSLTGFGWWIYKRSKGDPWVRQI